MRAMMLGNSGHSWIFNIIPDIHNEGRATKLVRPFFKISCDLEINCFLPTAQLLPKGKEIFVTSLVMYVRSLVMYVRSLVMCVNRLVT